MRNDPDLEEVVYGPRGMLSGIQAVLDAQCLVSGVSLIFSTMDAISALTRPDPSSDTNKLIFEAWVNKYLLESSSLRCSATDLYAARCGILHTYGYESRLGRQQQSRPIVYEWLSGPSADLGAKLPPNAIIVKVDSLFVALKSAIQKYLYDLERDPTLESLLEGNLPSLLCYIPWPALAPRALLE